MTEPLAIPSPPRATPDAARRRTSIERRLPLVMTAVLVAVLATSLVLTYRMLATAARVSASARLVEVARFLALSAEQSGRTRAIAVERVARDTAIVRALETVDSPDARARLTAAASARARLARLEVPTDSGMPTLLWTADGRQVVGVGSRVVPVARPELPLATATTPPPDDSSRIGAPYVVDGRVYFQIVTPVDAGGRRLGYIVQQRRILNNAYLATQLRGLTGEDVALYFHQRGSRLWAALDGTPSSAPDIDEAGLVLRAEGGPRLTTQAAVGGTPWLITLEEPLATVLRRPRAVLRELALLSVVLTLAGAAASWIIGRRIARPLVSLTAAAEAIARGDYQSRVGARGGDEVGRLARSFNAMAGEVETSQRALARQYGDARAVAEELEAANRQLHGAMHAVEEARDAAEQANRAKSDFLAVMSHELRTPLNAIGGYAELMQLGIYGAVTDEQARALARVTRSQQHLLGLINDVLDFARLNAAKVRYDIDDVPVHEALAAVETMVAPQLAAKAHRYACAPADPALTVRADREKLQQILLNLMSNAVKFTGQGGSIVVDCAADEGTVRIAVRDTGVGIPPERLRYVFEPFVQVERALNRPHDGVGLGLAISHDLALGMNGTLTAESTLGEGSTFTLVLPRGSAAPAPAGLTASDPAGV